MSADPPSQISFEEIHQMIAAIRGDDKNKRMHGLSNIHIIAQALRPERTRTELIPYVIETVNLTSVELKKIASELGIMLKEVGGPKEVTTLTKALKFICENEGSEVRAKAVESIIYIAETIDDKEMFNSHFSTLIQDFCVDCWYPLRCAAAGILCSLYTRFTKEIQGKLQNLLTTLSSDSIVLVKKTLVQYLPNLIETKACDPKVISSIIKTMAEDESPAVTIELPKSLAVLASSDLEVALSSADVLFNSKTWQPRAVLISYLDKICLGEKGKEFAKSVTEASVISPSVEIRAAIARKLPFVYTCKAYSVFEEFNRIVSNLSSDQETSVRIAVAHSVGEMKEAPKDFLSSILTLHLADEEFDVKMAALSSVASTGCALEAASKNLSDLIRFSTWRVKKGIALLIPKIAEPLEASTFNSNLLKIVITLLNDEAAEVRQAMVQALEPLAKHYGDTWMNEQIIPLINQLYASNDYMLRKTAVLAIITLHLLEKCSDLMDKLVKDPIANVRMVAARELPASETKYLDILVKDSDPDVAAYAKK